MPILFEPQTSFKALGIGLPKTGTTTLYDAFVKAGFQALHQNSGWRSPPAGNLMVQAWQEGLSIGHYLPFVEVVTQLESSGKHKHSWPQFSKEFLLAFRKEYPEAKIILHTRDPQKTLDSINRWGNFRERICKSAPGLDENASDVQIVTWIMRYYKNAREWFEGDPNFVSFDIEDMNVAETLSEAMGVEFPWWGRSNIWKPGVKG